jgi:endoglucanase
MATAAALTMPGLLGVAAGCGGRLPAGAFGASPAFAGPAPPLAPRPPRQPMLTSQDAREWCFFRERFIDPDGRVIDTGNRGISHSEGQGWGLLFAVSFDDRARFDSVLGWTLRTLRRDEDSLLRWRYDPHRADPVDDPNNATDGDLFVAWALWKAAFRWREPRYAALARLMAQDILNLLVVQAGARTVLLPGVFGFETASAVTVNPSYLCFPALRDLAEAVPSILWGQLRESGLALVEQGRFGAWRLPPDWLSVARDDGALSPAAGWPARFSYDAIRIPLYLAWDRQQAGETQQAIIRFWASTAPRTPAWVDLRNGVVAAYGSSLGMVAVAKLTAFVANRTRSCDLPSLRSSTDYYSSALILLSRLAVADCEAIQSD